MNLPRIFANAVARRVAFVVVGVAFAFIASCFAEARAQDARCGFDLLPSQPTTYSDISAAYAACSAAPDSVRDSSISAGWFTSYFDKTCEVDIPNNRVRLVYASKQQRNTPSCEYMPYPVEPGSYLKRTYTFSQGCPSGSVWDSASNTCSSCSTRAPLGPGAWGGVNENMQMCQDGCTFEGGIGGGGVGVCLSVVIDGDTYQQCTSWGPTGEACSAGVGNGSLAPADSDGDGTSDGNDGSPNNPGSGGGGKGGKPGEDGSRSCGGPGQPECAEDGSNSGSGKGNTSGGGGNCQTPPSSTGDAILAQIAYQAWATRCAVEGLGEGGTGTVPGDGDGDQPDWTKGDGPDAPEDTSAEDVAEASNWGIGISADLLNTENIFGESSCPALPSLSIMGYDIDTASFSWWCTLVSIMRAAILIMGAFTAIQILLGRF